MGKISFAGFPSPVLGDRGPTLGHEPHADAN